MPLQCNAVSSPVYAVTRLALWNPETSAVITFVEEVLPLHIRYIRKIPKTFVDLICIWSVFRVVSSKLLNKYIFGFLIGHLDRFFYLFKMPTRHITVSPILQLAAAAAAAGWQRK